MARRGPHEEPFWRGARGLQRMGMEPCGCSVPRVVSRSWMPLSRICGRHTGVTHKGDRHVGCAGRVRGSALCTAQTDRF